MQMKWRVVLVISVVLGLAVSPAQGPELSSVMREKLEHTQKILEAMVTSDWIGLEMQTRELERLTNDPRWTVLRYPEYARHSAAFRQAVQNLQEAAARRDLEKTPPAYVALTLNCVACHRYLARARMAW